MAARDVKVFRGDVLLGTHSLGEGEVVTVEAVKRKDQDEALVNPPDVDDKQRVKVGTLTDFVVTIGVPEPKKAAKKAPAKSQAKKPAAVASHPANPAGLN